MQNGGGCGKITRPMLEVQNISFAWGKAPLLDDVTFSVAPGEVAALEEHLVSRDAKEQPKVDVLDGPKEVPFGFPPVTCLLKESGLLVAVNLAMDAVTVRITLPDGSTFDETLPRNGVSVRECRGGVR